MPANIVSGQSSTTTKSYLLYALLLVVVVIVFGLIAYASEYNNDPIFRATQQAVYTSMAVTSDARSTERAAYTPEPTRTPKSTQTAEAPAGNGGGQIINCIQQDGVIYCPITPSP